VSDHIEPTDGEREVLARILDETDPEGGVWPDPGGGTWEWWLPQVDALLAAGFHWHGPITEDWEYAVRDAKGCIWFKATAGARPGDVKIRRRKAGEWEQVEDA
jgi:hypothetical protein